ncbi:MAG: FAD:protein FMN transferase [Bradymonadaceae bacterium]
MFGSGCSPETGADPDGARSPSSPGGRAEEAAYESLRRRQSIMGTTFRIEVRTTRPEAAARAIDAAFDEVVRLDGLLSSWESTSELSRVNRRAGERPVEVGPELMEVVALAQRISRRTDGAFDLTFASCDSLWSFRPPEIPSSSELKRCRGEIGYEQIRIDRGESTIYLPDGDLAIGVGGIGKGYAVDRAARILERHGIHNYLVDGGGDVRVRAEDVSPWQVGIAHPRRRGELLERLTLEEGAVVTSGDYERYFERDGKRYHHILDPRTGRPARGTAAVTVVADRAARADALSTALFVQGPQRGLALADELERVEALIVDPSMERRSSGGFGAYLASGRRRER